MKPNDKMVNGATDQDGKQRKLRGWEVETRWGGWTEQQLTLVSRFCVGGGLSKCRCPPGPGLGDLEARRREGTVLGAQREGVFTSHQRRAVTRALAGRWLTWL